MSVSAPARAARRGERFAGLTAAIVRMLPVRLSRVVPPSLVGFAVINGFTFTVDLTLLSLLHGTLHWLLPVAVTCAYVAAFGLSFALNRAVNFRSHAEVGPQAARYLLVVVVNYLVWILGCGDGLAAIGVDYRIARIVAGSCEAGYMYVAMRWFVFRGSRGRAEQERRQYRGADPR
jgi:putative flippase GtrA